MTKKQHKPLSDADRWQSLMLDHLNQLDAELVAMRAELERGKSLVSEAAQVASTTVRQLTRDELSDAAKVSLRELIKFTQAEDLYLQLTNHSLLRLEFLSKQLGLMAQIIESGHDEALLDDHYQAFLRHLSRVGKTLYAHRVLQSSLGDGDIELF